METERDRRFDIMRRRKSGAKFGIFDRGKSYMKMSVWGLENIFIVAFSLLQSQICVTFFLSEKRTLFSTPPHTLGFDGLEALGFMSALQRDPRQSRGSIRSVLCSCWSHTYDPPQDLRSFNNWGIFSVRFELIFPRITTLPMEILRFSPVLHLPQKKKTFRRLCHQIHDWKHPYLYIFLVRHSVILPKLQPHR